MPIHRATDCSRVLYFRGQWVGFLYRFESWVDYQTRAVPLRVDLTALAAQLTAAEGAGARWAYAWPNNPNPPIAWLTPERFAPTTIPADDIVSALKQELASGPAPEVTRTSVGEGRTPSASR